MMLNRLFSRASAAGRFLTRHLQAMQQEAIHSKANKWAERGSRYVEQGDLNRALDCCQRSFAIALDVSTPYHVMSRILMPGPDYMEWLSHCHEVLRPKSYLEIGVSTGASLAFAQGDTRSVGIDPRPCIQKKIQSRGRLYPVTSDDFFERYNPLEELGIPRLEFVFIDGLHHFEQALKDFANVERYSDRQTVVLIHDCIPLTKLMATREPLTYLWTGDVWKVLLCLKKYRPDLKLGVIPTRPSGLAIVTNLDSNSRVLTDRFEEIVLEYQDQELDYDYLDLDENSLSKAVPNLTTNDWNVLDQFLNTCASTT